jgi:hypothetical protein
MRIRSTKPEFWRSERIASVSWDARLILKGLESYVDDNGVGRDDVALIVGDVFPRDMLASPRETVARVSEGISELSQAGLLWRYEAENTRLLYVSFWESIQRIDKPGKGRFPRPDGTIGYGDSEIRESVAKSRETLAPGTGEQGNRGTGEKPRTPVQTEPHSDETDEPAPQPAAAATRGADIVRRVIPKGHPNATLTALRIQASELLNTGTEPDTVEQALRLWCDKPGVGIGRTILSSLCSEVIKSRDRPNHDGQRRNSTDAKGNEYLRLAAELDTTNHQQPALEAPAS